MKDSRQLKCFTQFTKSANTEMTLNVVVQSAKSFYLVMCDIRFVKLN
jgi:hypothetical protein